MLSGLKLIGKFAAISGLAAASATGALAQTYPDKPIRVINAFAAGTASDVIPRLIL